MAGETTVLPASLRDADGSREARRLRRAGQIPGVVYGGGEIPSAADRGATLRRVLAHAGRSSTSTSTAPRPGPPQGTRSAIGERRPVHVDLLRVRMESDPDHVVSS